MNRMTKGGLEMTAAMTIAGTIGLCVVLSRQPAASIVFWRCVFGAMTLLVICAAMGMFRRDVISKGQLVLAILGGTAIVINWLLLFAAYPRASISIATVVYNTQPFMLMGLGALFLGEKVTTAKLFWLGVAFAGMVLIVQANSDASAVASDYRTGVLLSLAAAFAYAVAACITKKLAGVPPHLIALIQVTIGVLVLAPMVDFSAPPTTFESWAFLVTIGVVHTGLMYILLYGAIQKLPAHVTGALSFIYPVVTILVDFVAFGHRLQLLQLVGAAAILLAAAGSMLGWRLPRSKA